MLCHDKIVSIHYLSQLQSNRNTARFLSLAFSLQLLKNTIDFLKIKNGELGAVNFNNMIPVKSDYYSIIDLNQSTLTLNEAKYQKLLKEQLAWLNANYIQVKDKSYKLYTLYNKGKLPETMRERCCNFKLLEEKCLKYTIIDRSLHG